MPVSYPLFPDHCHVGEMLFSGNRPVGVTALVDLNYGQHHDQAIPFGCTLHAFVEQAAQQIAGSAMTVEKDYFFCCGWLRGVICMAEEFSCAAAGAPECPFMIRDENEDELVSMVQRHAKESHNENLSREDVLKHVNKNA
jgi:predicted small metal-binding protein